MWDVRGWERLADDRPPLVAAREEFLSWLAEVPEPFQTVWRQRLQSAEDYPHLSVRPELYLHHYFRNAGWAIEIEPEMPETPNKPDFRVTRGKDRIVVEVKTVLDEKTISQQTQRLRQLADNLTKKLSRVITIEPLSGLPSSLPAQRIRAQIEQRAKLSTDKVVEFDFSDVHQGSPYALKIVVLPGGCDLTEPGGVGGTISDVYQLSIGKRIRAALEEKANKYGLIDVPFLIAVYVEGLFPARVDVEIDALFGDREWQLPSGKVVEIRKSNGFFNSVREGIRRHERVSAVLFYRFKWLENHTHAHLVHIYHNPLCLKVTKPGLVSRSAPVDAIFEVDEW